MNPIFFALTLALLGGTLAGDSVFASVQNDESQLEIASLSESSTFLVKECATTNYQTAIRWATSAASTSCGRGANRTSGWSYSEGSREKCGPRDPEPPHSRDCWAETTYCAQARFQCL